jgi:hypothetical protein
MRRCDDVIQSLRPTQYIAKPPTPSYQFSDSFIYLRCLTKHASVYDKHRKNVVSSTTR